MNRSRKLCCVYRMLATQSSIAMAKRARLRSSNLLIYVINYAGHTNPIDKLDISRATHTQHTHTYPFNSASSTVAFEIDCAYAARWQSVMVVLKPVKVSVIFFLSNGNVEHCHFITCFPNTCCSVQNVNSSLASPILTVGVFWSSLLVGISTTIAELTA